MIKVHHLNRSRSHRILWLLEELEQPYTVKWDSTSQRQVREGLKSLENVQVRVTGLVLSQINAKGMKKYGYGETYGAYGDYHNN